MTFAPNFRFYRDDPQQRDALSGFDEIAAELRAELAARRALYPRLVAKGRMTQDAAAREMCVIAALLWENTFPSETRPHARPVASWTEKVHALRREITLRRTLYPRWIEAARIDAAEATRKLELIEALHDGYWHTIGEEPAAARAEVAAHLRPLAAAA